MQARASFWYAKIPRSWMPWNFFERLARKKITPVLAKLAFMFFASTMQHRCFYSPST
jgi:hypothetical protein